MKDTAFWRDRWKTAYKNAAFYQSDKNTEEYWDSMAQTDGGGLYGDEHIRLLVNYLFSEKLIDKHSTVLDVGCGSGGYVSSLAGYCRHITALDHSAKMLDLCRTRCEKEGLFNISYKLADYRDIVFNKRFDCILACLNPSTYDPDVLDKMLSETTKTVVYFSMDTDINDADAEPVYCGCNSVRFAEAYLREREIRYSKIPYVYTFVTDNKEVREVRFAYLVIDKGILG